MNTLERLKIKSKDYNKRMPSIKQISQLLTECGIKHNVSDSLNIVEYRSNGNRYVNSRHNGKIGKLLTIDNTNIKLDTSDSYYSWNSWGYALKIVELIEENNKNNKKEIVNESKNN